MHFKHAAIAAVASICALTMVACGGNDSVAPDPEADVTTVSSTSTTTAPPSTTPTTSTTTLPSTTPTTSTTSSTTTPAGPTDPLTGKTLSKNPVIAVKVDNTSFPQFGLSDADIIYTEQVEGGLTRLIALYHTVFPKEVGAVRSMRSTDMQLLPSYGKIVLVNSGGAGPNVRRMRASILVDVTEGFKGVWRSNARRAPYNLHANLQTIAKDHKGKAKSVGFEFAKNDLRLADARKAKDIDVTMIGQRTSFNYAKGRYWPVHSGTPYVDNDGAKVSVDNVIVQHVTDKPDGIIDPAGNPSFLTTTTGSGKFTLYRNGRAIDGTWSRSKKTDPTTFADAKGKPVTLHPGKTWVLLAPQTSTVNKG